MTLSQAIFVKYLRIRCEGTWRWVESEYCKRYNIERPKWSQSYGFDLCCEAMNKLGENDWV